MKKLILKLDGIKEMLTKEQMKKVVGGYDNQGTPGDPSGDNPSDGSGAGYKCCWDNDSSNCSSCNKNAKSDWTCVTGASLTSC